MVEFFHGWRRKVGLLTLVVALVLTGGWVRSFTRADIINLPGPASNYVFISGGQKFQLFSIGRWELHYWQFLTDEAIGVDMKIIPLKPLTYSSFPCIWNSWSVAKIGVYRSHTDTEPLKQMIPYWAIVLPLTLGLGIGAGSCMVANQSGCGKSS